jgi:hypothetical protein
MGVQTNLLLQQFISFNSNSSINTNPYLFSLSKNDKVTGRGTVFGTGFSVSDNSTNDGVSAIHRQDANVTIRLGSERKYRQNEKFIPFHGVDFGMGVVYSKVSSRLVQSVSSQEIVTETRKIFFGPALRGGLLYTLSKHVYLGTECFFNFQLAFSETSVNSGVGSNSDVIPINLGFQAPTALFLIYRY